MTDNTEALMILAALGAVPDIGESFRHTDRFGETGTYTVKGWMRRRPPRKPDPDPFVEEALQVVDEAVTRNGLRRGFGPDSVPLSFCHRHEAEYVIAGNGLIEIFARVSDVRVLGRSRHWSDERIEHARYMAELTAGEPLL